MANVVLPKIRCNDEKADNEKTSSSGAPSSRKKASVAEGINKIQSKIATDTNVVLRVDGLGPIGGTQEDIKDEKPLLVAKLDPQIAEQVQWDDLKNKKKLDQNLHELLLIKSIGIKIEITKSRGCRGAVVIPVFHCKRCLQNWTRFKRLPTDCNEEPEYIRGLPILIEQSSITELEENKEGSNITLPSIDWERDTPNTGNSVSSNEDIYLEKLTQKYEGRKQKLENKEKGLQVKKTLPDIPPFDQGGRTSQLEGSIRRPSTASKDLALNDVPGHTPTGILPLDGEGASPRDAIGSRESERVYSSSSKSQRAKKGKSKGGQREGSSSQRKSLSVDKEGLELPSKTNLHVNQGDLEVTKGSSLIKIYSAYNVGSQKADEVINQQITIRDDETTIKKTLTSQNTHKKVALAANERTEVSTDTESDGKIQSQKHQEFRNDEKDIKENADGNKISGKTERQAASTVKERTQLLKKAEDKNFLEQSSATKDSLEQSVDHKVTVEETVANIKTKAKERRKSIQSSVKNPAVANRTGKPDTAHQPLKKHMMALAKGTPTNFGGLEGQREDLGKAKPSYTRRPSMQEPRINSSSSRRGSHFSNNDTSSSATTVLNDLTKERKIEAKQKDDYGIGFRSNSMLKRTDTQSDTSHSQGLPLIDDKVQRIQNQEGRKTKETYKKKTRKGNYNELLGRRKSKDVKDLWDSNSVTSSSNDLPPLFEIEDFRNTAEQASPVEKESENKTLGSLPFKYETRRPSIEPNTQGNNISYLSSINRGSDPPFASVETNGRIRRQTKVSGEEKLRNSRNRRVSFADVSPADDFSATLGDKKAVESSKPEPRSLTPSPEPAPRKKVTSIEIAALKMMSFTSSFTFSYYDLPKPYIDFNEMVKTSINSVGRRARRRLMPARKKNI